ncbi:MAG: hypothetical protein F4X34_04295 [Chloroflexi bacterium]|nr:hypothetical protein [Chloroflexota bacterium]
MSLMLEYEERAIKPVRMHERLLRYRRYFSALETQGDFQNASMVALVFPDAAAASRCSTFALKEARRAKRVEMRIPLLIGSLAGLEAEGALGPLWLMPSNLELGAVRLESLLKDGQSRNIYRERLV